MKRIFAFILLLMFAVIPLFPQPLQCIFRGNVMIHPEIFPNPCSTEPPVIHLMFPSGDSFYTAVYNPETQWYGVSAFSDDGFHDSDVVQFRILYNCDTLIAKTNGDTPIFVGGFPPVLKLVNLTINRRPYFTEFVSDTAREDFLYQRQIVANDLDSDAVSFSLISAPSWLSIDEETGMIQGTPGASDVGTQQITVEVNDGYFRGTNQLTYTLVVLHTNHMPRFTSVPTMKAFEDIPYQYQVTATDPDGDLLTFRLMNSPAWLSIDSLTGLIQGTPHASDVGSVLVHIYCSDGSITIEQSYLLQVHHTNHAPSPFHLLTPTKFDTIEYHPSDSVQFSWSRAHDSDAGDIVGYELVVVNVNLDTLRFSTTDTFKTIAMTQLQPWMAYAWSVFATDGIETVAASDTFFFFMVDVNEVIELPGIPTTYALEQNYPNPFNPSTNFGFRIADFGFVSLKVYDVYGREVATLVNETMHPGNYQVTWDAQSVAGGTYFATLRATNFTETRKVMLVK